MLDIGLKSSQLVLNSTKVTICGKFRESTLSGMEDKTIIFTEVARTAIVRVVQFQNLCDMV